MAMLEAAGDYSVSREHKYDGYAQAAKEMTSPQAQTDYLAAKAATPKTASDLPSITLSDASAAATSNSAETNSAHTGCKPITGEAVTTTATSAIETATASSPIETTAAAAPNETATATSATETATASYPIETTATTAPTETATATSVTETAMASSPIETTAAAAPNETATAASATETATSSENTPPLADLSFAGLPSNLLPTLNSDVKAIDNDYSAIGTDQTKFNQAYATGSFANTDAAYNTLNQANTTVDNAYAQLGNDLINDETTVGESGAPNAVSSMNQLSNLFAASVNDQITNDENFNNSMQPDQAALESPTLTTASGDPSPYNSGPVGALTFDFTNLPTNVQNKLNSDIASVDTDDTTFNNEQTQFTQAYNAGNYSAALTDYNALNQQSTTESNAFNQFYNGVGANQSAFPDAQSYNGDSLEAQNIQDSIISVEDTVHGGAGGGQYNQENNDWLDLENVGYQVPTPSYNSTGA